MPSKDLWVKTLPYNPKFLDTEKENIVGKRENAGKSAFSLFPQCFSTHPKKNFYFKGTFILSSANTQN